MRGRYGTDFIMNVDSGVYNMRVYTAYGKIYDGTVEYSDGLTDNFNAACRGRKYGGNEKTLCTDTADI